MTRLLEKTILGILVIAAIAAMSFWITAESFSASSADQDTVMQAPTPSAQVVLIDDGLAEKDRDDEDDADEGELTVAQVQQLNPQINEEQARQIASAAVSGKITDIELENTGGHTVYAVEIDHQGDETDVKIDVYTGEIVQIDRASQDSKEDYDA